MEEAQKDSSEMVDESRGSSDGVNNRVEEFHAGKRQREEDLSDDSAVEEPDEKRRAGTFKLNPPILIHGKAKSAPKEEETTTKRKFLRPSTLSAPSTVSHLVTTSSSSFSVGSKLVSSIIQAPLLGSSLTVSSKNPFLITSDESKETDSPLEDVVGKEPSINNCGSATNDMVANGKENVFLKLQSKASSTADSPEESSGFVFGSKMEERVVESEADSTCSGSGETQEFLFGKNLSDRVKVANPDNSKAISLQTAPAESVLFHDSVKPEVTSSTCGNRLEESAAVLFAASNTVVVMPEVEVKTGEEDEKNVLQFQCKLYQYDSNNSKNWIERGRGILRLNDRRLSSADCKFQSRLVMRTNGSLRLILNTKIWATMMVDRASPKSVRISAQNEDGDICVYLITATINDAEQLYRAIEYRLLHLKQLEENVVKKTKQSESNADSLKNSVTPLEISNTKAISIACITRVVKQKNFTYLGSEQTSSPLTTGSPKPDTTSSAGAQQSVDGDSCRQANTLRPAADEGGDLSPGGKADGPLPADSSCVVKGENADPSSDGQSEQEPLISQITSQNGETKNTKN